MLEELLYGRRLLLDAFDKNMCLMLTQDWPCMAFVRRGFQQRTRSSEAVEPLIPDILKLVHERGCLSAQELNLPQKMTGTGARPPWAAPRWKRCIFAASLWCTIKPAR